MTIMKEEKQYIKFKFKNWKKIEKITIIGKEFRDTCFSQSLYIKEAEAK